MEKQLLYKKKLSRQKWNEAINEMALLNIEFKKIVHKKRSFIPKYSHKRLKTQRLKPSVLKFAKLKISYIIILVSQNI